jgi:hypothetical protein
MPILACRYLQAGQKAPAARQPAEPAQLRPQPIQEQPQPSFAAGRWYAGIERGTKLSQSRVLTEREMELIELGGASP